MVFSIEELFTESLSSLNAAFGKRFVDAVGKKIHICISR